MNADTFAREQLLAALEPRFSGAGFRRPKAQFEWRRRVAQGRLQVVHFNFGRSGNHLRVSPSLGVRHDEVERFLEATGVHPASRTRPTFWTTLAPLAGGEYMLRTQDSEVGESPNELGGRVWADWLAEGEAVAERMADLSQAINRMIADDPKEWWCASRSHRARILPAALAAAGRTSEARTWLSRLSAELAGRDQLLPGLADFATRFAPLLG